MKRFPDSYREKNGDASPFRRKIILVRCVVR